MFPGIVSRHRNLHGAMRRPRDVIRPGGSGGAAVITAVMASREVTA